METNEELTPKKVQAEQQEEESTYSYSHTFIWLVLGCIVLAVGVVAALLCREQVRYNDQQILEHHRKVEQAWIDSRLDAVHTWLEKVLEPVDIASQSEGIRFLATEKPEQTEKNADPKEEPGGQNPTNEENSENSYWSYYRDIFVDNVRVREWTKACIVDKDGQEILSTQAGFKLGVELQACIERAAKTRQTSFSTVYVQNGHTYMDIVNPLYEVMSALSVPAITGYLLVTVPMDTIIADFLSSTYIRDVGYKPSILTPAVDGFTPLQLVEGKVVVGKENISSSEFKFQKRESVIGKGSVWSSGGRLLMQPSWVVLLERDAGLVEEEMSSKAREIYGFGVLGSLMIALILAIAVGTWISRHKAKEGQKCISGLVHAIECALDGSDAKERYLQGRSQKVAKLGDRLAREMHLSNLARENISLAAQLSQVGKIFVPRDIMIKRGLLTDAERKQVQLAPYHAYNVLKVVLPNRVARIVYQMGGKVVDDPESGANHELTLKEMLPESRVLLVANDFCAMVSQRGARPPLPMPDARKKLTERAIYDPQVVKALNTVSDAEIMCMINSDELA